MVDDEPGMLRAIERVLGTAHHVTACGSSREALRLAATVDPQLAILDIRMPELDGFELMARLKERHSDIDVILMTGSVDDQDEKLIRAIRGTAFYFIQKPFDREVLRTLVDRCVELRHQRDENRRHVARLEQELAAARAFQQGLLPPPDIVLSGITLACRQIPSSELGGDLYDYVQDRSGRNGLARGGRRRPRRVGGHADRRRQVGVPGRSCRRLPSVGGDRPRSQRHGLVRLRAVRDIDCRARFAGRIAADVRQCRTSAGTRVERGRTPRAPDRNRPVAVAGSPWGDLGTTIGSSRPRRSPAVLHRRHLGRALSR